MLALITSFNILPGDPSQCNKAIKRNKIHIIRKEKVNLPLFTDSMIVYIKIFNETTKQKL